MPLKIGFLTINTTDIENSIRFYADILGFRLEQRIKPRPGLDMAFLFDEAGQQIQLVQGRPGKPGQGCGPVLGFIVDDIQASSDLLKQHKVRISSELMTMPTGVRTLSARDPNGVELQFVQLV